MQIIGCLLAGLAIAFGLQLPTRPAVRPQTTSISLRAAAPVMVESRKGLFRDGAPECC